MFIGNRPNTSPQASARVLVFCNRWYVVKQIGRELFVRNYSITSSSSPWVSYAVKVTKVFSKPLIFLSPLTSSLITALLGF